jgi:hypothetical protein
MAFRGVRAGARATDSCSCGNQLRYDQRGPCGALQDVVPNTAARSKPFGVAGGVATVANARAPKEKERLQPVAVFNASYSSGVSATMKTMRVRSNAERCESRYFQI